MLTTQPQDVPRLVQKFTSHRTNFGRLHNHLGLITVHDAGRRISRQRAVGCTMWVCACYTGVFGQTLHLELDYQYHILSAW